MSDTPSRRSLEVLLSVHPNPLTPSVISPTVTASRPDGLTHDNSVTCRVSDIHGERSEPLIKTIMFTGHGNSLIRRPGQGNNCVTVSETALVSAETISANSPLISPEISVIAALRSGATTMVGMFVEGRA